MLDAAEIDAHWQRNSVTQARALAGMHTACTCAAQSPGRSLSGINSKGSSHTNLLNTGLSL